MPKWQVQALIDVATKSETPFTISLIPIFADPYLATTTNPDEKYLPMAQRPEFVTMIRQAQSHGGTVIMHGVTHQSDNLKNPYGASGADYEFWDSTKNHAMAQDSPQFVVNRLEQGLSAMEDAGLKPAAWECPHYESSPTDNVIFSQLFQWNVGRLWYLPFQSVQKTKLPDLLTFDLSGKESNGLRLPYFADLKLETPDGLTPAGQLYPYEIYGDVYGQRVVPEDIGYLRIPSKDDTPEGVTVTDFLRILKRNRNLRDVWGSMFVHPYIINDKANGGMGDFQGDTRMIERLLRETKKLGYQFVNLRDWMKANLRPNRPDPIETR